MIVGVLSSLALPSFLNQVNRARESEAKNYIGTINRGQQAYFVTELQLATDIDDLEIGLPQTGGEYQTNNYLYEIVSDDPLAIATVQARPVRDSLRAHIGVAAVVSQGQINEVTTTLCEAELTPASGGADGTQVGTVSSDGSSVECASDYEEIS